MPKDAREIIERAIRNREPIKSEELSRQAGISRQAAHKELARQVRQGILKKMGSTRNSYYLPATAKEKEVKRKAIRLSLKNRGLEEDLILDRLEQDNPPLRTLPPNTRKIFRYAFSEMLNNAIEHSRSPRIGIEIYFTPPFICFEISDSGIGVFKNIMKKYGLKDELESIQELLKGKRTTAPRKHSGEGIFFTSKISDQFELYGSDLCLMIDNLIEDTAVKQIPPLRGTKVIFRLNQNTKKDLAELFNKYTDEDYKFSKTMVVVKLYERGADYVSRSQARRILFGLESFKTIVLDFAKIKGIGQAFADEIFRIYKQEHPKIDLIPKNANKTVSFMVKRASAGLRSKN